MDSKPYRQTLKFIDLLNSQQDIYLGYIQYSVELSSSQTVFLGTQGTEDSNFGEDTPAERREREKERTNEMDANG